VPRWAWRRYSIAVTEVGKGSLVLLVHGIYAGSSSYEFRRLLPLLSKHYRVVALDLLGCGGSDKPDIDYDAQLYTDLIVDAVGEFGPQATAIVGSSLGAAFSVRAARRLDSRLAQLVTICPSGLNHRLADPQTDRGRALTRFVRSPLAGRAAFALLASRPSIAWFLKHQAYADAASTAPEVLDHYSQVTHLRGARFVAAHFLGGALNCDIFKLSNRLTIDASGSPIGLNAFVRIPNVALGNAERLRTTHGVHPITG
jgi:pimeloyl-ACP methyl ester carboxylesterase